MSSLLRTISLPTFWTKEEEKSLGKRQNLPNKLLHVPSSLVWEVGGEVVCVEGGIGECSWLVGGTVLPVLVPECFILSLILVFSSTRSSSFRGISIF